MFTFERVHEVIFKSIVIVTGYTVNDDFCMSTNFPADIKNDKGDDFHNIEMGLDMYYAAIDNSDIF